jgi:hypothetical protein
MPRTWNRRGPFLPFCNTEATQLYLDEIGARVATGAQGNVVVGPKLEVAVFRAIYTEVNAKLQIQASMLDGPIIFLNEVEAAQPQVMRRPWDFWKRKLHSILRQ